MKQGKSSFAPKPIPWQVSLWNPWRPHFCSGVILDHKTILSAASCFKKLKAMKWIRISAGNIAYKGGQSIHVKKLHFLDHETDLSIVKLKSSLQFDENTLPACLPSAKISANSRCYFSGWGQSTKLRWLNVRITSQSNCSINPEHICTHNNYCIGCEFDENDAGGPLVCLQNEHPVIVGIASSIGNEIIHTKIQNHIDWIKQLMVSFKSTIILKSVHTHFRNLKSQLEMEIFVVRMFPQKQSLSFKQNSLLGNIPHFMNDTKPLWSSLLS